jgi:hypothetical protein
MRWDYYNEWLVCKNTKSRCLWVTEGQCLQNKHKHRKRVKSENVKEILQVYHRELHEVNFKQFKRLYVCVCIYIHTHT